MSASSPNLLALAEKLVKYGSQRGATEMEVTATEATSFRVAVRDGAVESLLEASPRELSLRLFCEGRVAVASSSDLSEPTLQRLVDRAMERARLAGADPFAGLPEFQAPPSADALKLWDPAILEMSPEAKIARAKELEALGLKDKRIGKSLGASFSTGYATVSLANSKGFSGSYRSSSASTGVTYQAGEGQNLFQEGWYDTSRSLKTLMSNEALAAKAVNRATRLISARKVESQNVPVVLEPPMAAQLLSFLAQCLGGRAINQKQSFLAGKLGETLGSDLVTILDDGLLPGGTGSSPFDSEGTPCRKTALVEKGVLKSYLLDAYNARKLKLASTGNAGGATNLYLQKGASTPEEMVKSMDKGLLLTGTMGQGTVATTGDLSRGAFGLWVEKGEVVHPVAEITISGNLGQLLKNVVMVGNDLEFRSSISSPTIKIAEMTVGGK